MTKNQIATKPTNALAHAQDHYINSITSSFQTLNLKVTDYQKVCAMNVIGKMYAEAKKNGLSLSKDYDQSNLADILQTVTMLGLNATATPRECYVITRNEKQGEQWVKKFELGIEGDGNDKLLREYGVNIKDVHPIWVVRENDEFHYPEFVGIEQTPPKWRPKDYHSKIVRVVYPIEYNDGKIVYNIAEREGVIVNLKAHLQNNVMKSKDAGYKQKILDALDKCDKLEDLYANPILVECMSPAWKGATKEEMLLRKMRNNVVKKHPKQFENAFQSMEYENTYEDYDQYRDNRINSAEALDAEVETKTATQEIAGPTIEKTQQQEEQSVILDINEETGEVIEQPQSNQNSLFDAMPDEI